MNTENQKVVERVGLIGVNKSGKTNLFHDLSSGFERGFHGYPLSLNLQIEPTPSTRRQTRKHQYRDPDTATLTVKRGTWIIRYHTSTEPNQHNVKKSKPVERRVELIDGPGETQFPIPGAGNPVKERRDEQNTLLKDATGLIITIPALKLNDTKYTEQIVDIIHTIKEEAGDMDPAEPSQPPPPPLSRVERVVIAVTMFDLLMFRFRERALDFAAIPEFVAKILGTTINNRLWDGINQIKRHFDRNHVDLRFIATSSWGFHPDYGCANLDPNGQKPNGSVFGQRLEDINDSNIVPDDYKRYPYMAADPVIFAALGIENEFLLKQEQIQQL